MNKMILACAVVGVAAGAGGWALFGGGVGPSPEEALRARAEAARELWVRDEEMHEVALFSYVRPGRGTARRSSMPVMLQLDVKGRDGLDAFCNAVPRLKEAVLRVLNKAGVSAGGDLDRVSGSLKAAINGIVPGGPVERVRTSVLWDAGVGGAASYRTDEKCRDFV